MIVLNQMSKKPLWAFITLNDNIISEILDLLKFLLHHFYRNQAM